MLDVHRLRIFRSVVASGSVAAAAANLGYTPSAVSQHVTALQRETGLTLLERAGRGVRPSRSSRTCAPGAQGPSRSRTSRRSVRRGCRTSCGA
jgi:DNA-binding transcriptional LysR family regulator